MKENVCKEQDITEVTKNSSLLTQLEQEINKSSSSVMKENVSKEQDITEVTKNSWFQYFKQALLQCGICNGSIAANKFFIKNCQRPFHITCLNILSIKSTRCPICSTIFEIDKLR